MQIGLEKLHHILNGFIVIFDMSNVSDAISKCEVIFGKVYHSNICKNHREIVLVLFLNLFTNFSRSFKAL